MVVEVRRRRQKKRRLESKAVFEQRDNREPVSLNDIVYSEIADLDCENAKDRNAKDPIYAEPQNCLYFDVDGTSEFAGVIGSTSKFSLNSETNGETNSETDGVTNSATKTLPEIYDEVYMVPTVMEPFLTVMENGHYEA